MLSTHLCMRFSCAIDSSKFLNRTIFLKSLRITSSLRKYIGCKGGEPKVKDTRENFNKIGIIPTPKAF